MALATPWPRMLACGAVQFRLAHGEFLHVLYQGLMTAWPHCLVCSQYEVKKGCLYCISCVNLYLSLSHYLMSLSLIGGACALLFLSLCFMFWFICANQPVLNNNCSSNIESEVYDIPVAPVGPIVAITGGWFLVVALGF